ncbi:MAG: putative Ig domain-containing protein, partial [Actinobacteria bacterium]|nr:putative Ig domain-containing protein [Actinomycetota bacterium]
MGVVGVWHRIVRVAVAAVVGVAALLVAQPAAMAATAPSATVSITAASPTYQRVSANTCTPSATTSNYAVVVFTTNGIGNDTFLFSVTTSATVTVTLYQGVFLPASPGVNCYITAKSIAAGTSTFTTGYNNTGVGIPDQTWYVVIASDAPGAGVTSSVTMTTSSMAVTANPPATPTLSVSPTTLPSGGVGGAYSQTITASGGTGPYTFAVTAGSLPVGLSLSSAGVLSGTPTAAETFNFTVTATDSGGFTGSRAYSLTVGAPTITVSPATLPSAVVGGAYSQTITASGGTGPYALAVTAGSVPAGLSLSSAGVLSGTPTAAGTFNFTVTATDAGGFTGSRAYSLTVGAPTITVSPATLPSAVVGGAYSQTITASGGTGPYTFAVTAGSFPAGLSFSSAGVLSGTPTAAGTFNLTMTATDANGFTGSRAYSLTVGAPTITVSPATLPNATAGSVYSQTITASGGTGPYAFAVTAGSVPAGLSLSSGGVLSGTPTDGGSFAFTVSATDSSTPGPFTASQSYTLDVALPVLTLAGGTLPGGTVGTAFTAALPAAVGGVAPLTYSAAGVLPAGLSLSADGVLSGMPTQAGTFTFDVAVVDSTGGTGPARAVATFTIVVAAAPAPPAAP